MEALARALTIRVPAAMQWQCSQCRRDLPVTSVRLTLKAVTLEYECAHCRIVHAGEYLQRRTRALDKAEAVLDAAFERIL